MTILNKATQPNMKLMCAHPAHWLAFGFGSGLTKKAPGTFGTLVGFPLFMLIADFTRDQQWLMITILFLAGIYICEKAGKSLGVSDHGSIVWDEIVAMMLVLTVTPKSWLWWIIAFLLFRLFDIWKPAPIRQCDAKFKTGLGVMLDDLLAAIYTICVIQLLVWIKIPI